MRNGRTSINGKLHDLMRKPRNSTCCSHSLVGFREDKLLFPGGIVLSLIVLFISTFKHIMQTSHVILAVVAALCLVVVNDAYAIPQMPAGFNYMQYVPAEYQQYVKAYMGQGGAGAAAGGMPSIPNFMGAGGAGGIPGMGNFMGGGAGGANFANMFGSW
ncbi:hypothetical protein LOTGIDRAFT_227782 [Lottia gigantea]|uniref:Uncharacterized protein n=1 Tax=Lottia gigantea TaxID=225164 RepID=V4CRE7_LOTGI|nr:hypothetical protein LOTGIDRAFT_227782 [Lottia gigantea]ESP05075.1 hypothetical protein LOTGIDRAFT_227782 [Lottia gigantea]